MQRRNMNGNLQDDTSKFKITKNSRIISTVSGSRQFTSDIESDLLLEGIEDLNVNEKSRLTEKFTSLENKEITRQSIRRQEMERNAQLFQQFQKDNKAMSSKQDLDFPNFNSLIYQSSDIEFGEMLVSLLRNNEMDKLKQIEDALDRKNRDLEYNDDCNNFGVFLLSGISRELYLKEEKNVSKTIDLIKNHEQYLGDLFIAYSTPINNNYIGNDYYLADVFRHFKKETMKRIGIEVLIRDCNKKIIESNIVKDYYHYFGSYCGWFISDYLDVKDQRQLIKAYIDEKEYPSIYLFLNDFRENAIIPYIGLILKTNDKELIKKLCKISRKSTNLRNKVKQVAKQQRNTKLQFKMLFW